MTTAPGTEPSPEWRAKRLTVTRGAVLDACMAAWDRGFGAGWQMGFLLGTVATMVVFAVTLLL